MPDPPPTFTWDTGFTFPTEIPWSPPAKIATGGTAMIKSGQIDLLYISETISQGLDYFWDNLETYLTEYIDTFWPYDTGNYHDKMVESIHRIGNEVVIDGADQVDYAEPVERMVGVKWTNPMTQEQPVTHLRDFLKGKMKDLLVEAFISKGLQVLY